MVVTMMNRSVEDDTRPEDVDQTNVYAYLREGRRKLVEDIDFVAYVAAWEMGAIELSVGEDGLKYFEFVNTKLEAKLAAEQGIVVSVEEEVEPAENEVASSARSRVSEARVRQEADRNLRETPISSEEADERTRVLQLISSQDGNRRLDEWDYWSKEVCTFFQVEDLLLGHQNPLRIPGLRGEIDPYQLAGAFWLLTRYSADKIAGPILGDDPGLGKTTILIVAIQMLCHAHEVWEDVKKFRKEAAASVFEHNEQGAGKGRKCPSHEQIPAKYGIRCPCVPGSASMNIVENMHNWPSIVIYLKGQGITTWVSEWDKTVGPDSFLRLYVNKDDYQGKPHLEDFVREINDAPMPEEIPEGQPEGDSSLSKARLGFEGGSRHVLLSSDSMSHKLVKASENSGFLKTHGAGKKAVAAPVAGCAILALDEMHKYNGSLTQPFQLLEILGTHPTKSTLAVAVSGSLGSLGPREWRFMVQHNRKHCPENKLGRLKNGVGG